MQNNQVIEKQEMVAKVKAAVDARTDDDFVIMARTDALSVNGLEEAVERGNLWGAGRVMITITGSLTPQNARKRLCRI